MKSLKAVGRALDWGSMGCLSKQKNLCVCGGGGGGYLSKTFSVLKYGYIESFLHFHIFHQTENFWTFNKAAIVVISSKLSL